MNFQKAMPVRKRKMDPLARKVLENEFARMRQARRDLNTHCLHGHKLSGENVREYEYEGYMHRTCMVCVRVRSRRLKAERRRRAR